MNGVNKNKSKMVKGVIRSRFEETGVGAGMRSVRVNKEKNCNLFWSNSDSQINVFLAVVLKVLKNNLVPQNGIERCRYR